MRRFSAVLLLVAIAAAAEAIRIVDERTGAVIVDEDFSEDDDMVQLTKGGRRTYEGYQLLTARPATQKDLDNINFIKHGIVEFWTPLPRTLNSRLGALNSVDMLVNPLHLEQVTNFLRCSGVDFDVSINNIQKDIDQENDAAQLDQDDDEDELIGRNSLCTNTANFNWDSYQRYDVFVAYLRCLANEHKNKTRLYEIGSSYEGRPMYVLRVGTNRNNPNIWIDGGIHAREWISPATIAYILYELVENYGSRRNRELVDSYNFFIMPVVNPDGYEYSHTNDRFWRKTRSRHQTNDGRVCYGTDPNRNWGFEWGGEGASTNPCSQTFRGPRAFSEVETRNVRNFINEYIPVHKLKMFLTFHSYGQFILFPWGFSDQVADPDNVDDLIRVGNNAAAVMERMTGHEYLVGSAAKELYPAAGGSDDWAKGSLGVEYSYTVELPDTGKHGFLLPSRKIKATVQEAFEGVQTMVRSM